jgi:hypothetical protein
LIGTVNLLVFCGSRYAVQVLAAKFHGWFRPKETLPEGCTPGPQARYSWSGHTKGAATMAIQPETITELEPRLIERRSGGWLAVTDDDSPVRVGVVGDTEDEARERFREALVRWRAAYERPVDEQG